MNQTNFMIKLNRGNNMWTKYRHESKQTLVVIGFLVLAAKLCKADGHFNEVEEEEILKIVPHDKNQKKQLMNILEEGANDSNPIEHDAVKIKELIGKDHPLFLEFIIAALYRLAYVDDVYSPEEERDIRKVADVFGIKKTLLDKILSYAGSVVDIRDILTRKDN
jgi:Uncharacterized protein conserved in bacteria